MGQAKALGAAVTQGSKVALGELRGRRARLLVELDEEKGRNRVTGILPVEEPATSPTQTATDPDYIAWLADRKAMNGAGRQAGHRDPVDVVGTLHVRSLTDGPARYLPGRHP